MKKSEHTDLMGQWTKIFDFIPPGTPICWQQYCPHLDRIIQISTNPHTTECEQCVVDIKNKQIQTK